VLWLIPALVAVAAGAVYLYVWRERLGARGFALAGLRTLAMACLLALLGNASREVAAAGGPATVLLDASLSLEAAGGHWQAALDTARALAAGGGTVLRFGDGVTPFDSAPPTAGRSLVGPALRVAAARGGPVFLVTDGELEDFATLPDALRGLPRVVVLERDTVPDAALTDVAAPLSVVADDSVPLALTIATWGALPDTTAVIEVRSGARRLARHSVALPRAPGTARRRLALPPRALPVGTHVLAIRLIVRGDREPRDDLRQRVITVAALPAVVLLARPPDWESRFLARELDRIVHAGVRGYAEVTTGRWVGMRSLAPVSEARVRQEARQAALVITRGEEGFTRGAPVTWRWPSGGGQPVAAGDWYVIAPGATPLTGRLGAIEWDSLPPLLDVRPAAVSDGAWVVLAARLARRGAARPVVIARDSGATRTLVTAGQGLWRWALRGGAALEAYRALIAAGTDWLLGSKTTRAGGRLTASEVVPRGIPVTFWWHGDSVPPAVAVELTRGDSTRRVTLEPDASGVAEARLAPGVYGWRAPGAGAAGIVVVEPYSDEFHPAPVAASAAGGTVGEDRVRVGARALWWVFAVAIGALVIEWGWRMRRGLP
jgi:hypothetical protein